MFQVEMLPASEGDALWIQYGDVSAPRQILIDGGRAGTYFEVKQRLANLPEDRRKFELLVITHVDRDHIEGALALLEDPELDHAFDQIWFNGYDHLNGVEIETFGAVQGERLTAAILRRRAVWNKAFKGGPVVVEDGGSLPVVTLDGGLKLTILSPDSKKLQKLLPVWRKECEEAGLLPGIEARIVEANGLESLGALPGVEELATKPVVPDKTPANGSSIALLAEYCGMRVLLGADAHLDRLTSSVQRLVDIQGGRLELDALKLPHHGSSGNVSQALLHLVKCSRYLISTNGSYFHHPAPEAIARLLKFGGRGKSLHFNYATEFTSRWCDEGLQRAYDYSVHYPPGPQGALMVNFEG